MINWNEVQKVIFPIKDYEDLCQRLRISLGYPFVLEAYNFTLPELDKYTQRLLKGDPRGRYTMYAEQLTSIMQDLHKLGVADILDLKERTASQAHLEFLTGQVRVPATEIATLMKYLVYWVIPAEKYISGLAREDLDLHEAILALRENGMRTNLELLQAAITPLQRTALAQATRLAIEVVTDLVNRADFSRMPWASKATISNIIGAGYPNLARLADADPEKLYADFFRYGKSIGKNLKLGNEIENSFRIAKIMPKVLEEG